MELYSFQRELVDKFAASAHTHPNVLIGDDMGLGKTVSAIALDKSRRTCVLSERQASWIGDHRRMTLVVTKKSVIGSWEDHFAQWAPKAVVVSLSNTSRELFEHKALREQAHVFICNWESIRLMPKLANVPWLHLIADEVHVIKNRKAQVTVAFKKIQALFKTDMSGTWADNSPVDGWSILHHLYPRVHSSFWRYHNEHVLFRERVNHRTGNTYREIMGVANADKLQEQMAPYYIRRTKEFAAPDLPEKVYNTIRVRLHPKQQRAYDAMRRDMLAWVGENQDQPCPAPVVIAKLIRLQQFAIAYGRMEDIEVWKWREVPERAIERLRENGQKVRRHKHEDGTGGPWQAYLKEVQRKLFLDDPSAKLDAVMEWLEVIPSGESAVVFGTSKQAINLLANRLKVAGETHGVLTGDVHSDAERRMLVDGFQAGKFRVFLGTIKAGGVGITLTRASRMGFIDRDWSPSANRQTEDRTHRIGQKRTCFYTDFVAENTLDAERNERIEMKWDWIRQLLGDK